MKKRLLTLIIALLFAAPIRAQDPAPLWEAATAAYTAGDYTAAIAGYDSIRREGLASAALYYNLGNAYYKDGRMGPAILNYRRALRRAPGDANIRHNLVVADARIRDRIDAVPEFFVKTWARRAMYSAGTDAWAAWSLVLLTAALAGVLLYLLGSRMALRKAGFYGAVGLAGLALAALTFASIQRQKILHPDEAVIMLTAAPVRSEPHASGREVFVLHEGTTVRLIGELNSWREIVLTDGKQGWIDGAAIEVVD